MIGLPATDPNILLLIAAGADGTIDTTIRASLTLVNKR